MARRAPQRAGRALEPRPPEGPAEAPPRVLTGVLNHPSHTARIAIAR
jgi:hypothetical protein